MVIHLAIFVILLLVPSLTILFGNKLLFVLCSRQVVTPMTTNYPSAPASSPAASGPFSWVPRQMLSGDAAEEDGDSDGDSDRADEDRGEGDEAELVIDIPNE